MILPAVLFGLFQQSNLQDIHIPAASLERVIQQISDQYHSPMTISTNLRNQILVVEARQVSESQVRDQIAKAVDGTWEKKDSGWHLGQSAKQQGMERERRATLRLNMLQKMVERRVKSVGFKTVLSPTSATSLYNRIKSEQGLAIGSSESEFGDPTQKLLTKILAKMDLRDIAEIDNGERRVYALKPNAMQVPLNISLDQEIADFWRDNAIWTSAVEKLDDHSESIEARMARAVRGRAIRDNAMPEDVANVLVAVYTASNGAQEFTIFFLPKTAGESYQMIQASSSESIYSVLTSADMDAKAGEDKDFKLSEEALDFSKFYGQDTESIPKDRLAKLIAQVADPTKRDPLSFGMSEMIAYDSRKTHENYIAVLSDDDFNNEGVIFGNLDLLKRLEPLVGGVIAHEDNWVRLNFRIIEGPTYPRPDLKRIISNVRIRGAVTLEDQAEMAAACPRWQNTAPVLELLNSFVRSSQDENGDQDAIRTMGLMDMAEQNRAMSSGGIRFGNLNPRLRQHLFECVYYNQRHQLQMHGSKQLNMGSVAANEATLLAPKGISDDSIFRIERQDKDLIRLKSKDQPGGFAAEASAEEWGQIKLRAENPKDFPGSQDGMDLTQPLMRATNMTFEFILEVSPNCSWSSKIERTVNVTGPTFTFDSLPEDMKNQFQLGYQSALSSLNQMRAKEKSSGKGGGGR